MAVKSVPASNICDHQPIYMLLAEKAKHETWNLDLWDRHCKGFLDLHVFTVKVCVGASRAQGKVCVQQVVGML